MFFIYFSMGLECMKGIVVWRLCFLIYLLKGIKSFLGILFGLGKLKYFGVWMIDLNFFVWILNFLSVVSWVGNGWGWKLIVLLVWKLKYFCVIVVWGKVFNLSFSCFMNVVVFLVLMNVMMLWLYVWLDLFV